MSIIERRFRRELQRLLTLTDIRVLENAKDKGDPDSLDALAEYSAQQLLDLD